MKENYERLPDMSSNIIQYKYHKLIDYYYYYYFDRIIYLMVCKNIHFIRTKECAKGYQNFNKYFDYVFIVNYINI